MAIQDYYHDVTLRTVTEGLDDTGGTINTYVDTTIKALVTQASSSMIELANKMQVEVTHTMYCDVGIDFNYVDKVVDSGAVFQVSGEPLNTVKRNHHLRIPLKRVINNG